MSTITRSTGTPIAGSGLVAGGGYQGITRDLDLVVSFAAAALAEDYGQDVVIRFNSDRASGGAWLVTPDGRNAHVGICASQVTASQRAAWERWAADDSDPEWQALAREWLATSAEGELTVFAHITARAAGGRARELAALPGWNDMTGRPSAYHHGEVDTVMAALRRCKEFVPTPAMHQDAEDLARWEADGGA
jgi:hypothetical protein